VDELKVTLLINQKILSISVNKETDQESHIAETYFYNLPIDESTRIVTGDYRAFINQNSY
jgi:hypothetical protein